MADELRRFPSLDSQRTPSSKLVRSRTSESTSLTSPSSTLSRFPSLRSTRPSTITSANSVKTATTATTATSPSLLTRNDEDVEHTPSECVCSLEPVDISLYEELPLLDLDSIRILRVKPGNPGTPLECELLTTNLHEHKNRYSALSYTWEREAVSVPVLVNDRSFDMQQTLVDFICTIRSAHRHIRVWVDAVCIDQQSLTERNHQVQLMSRIYSNAACTQTWLGNDMPALSDRMRSVGKRPESSRPEHNNGYSADSKDMASERILLALLNHRYWTHTWIIQDILLAKDVWVHCGNEALVWVDFVRMVRRLANSLHQSSLRCLRLFDNSDLMHLHNLRRNTRSRGLPELLMNYATTGCENVQDRIFGLMGLITKRNDPLSASDASETVSRNRKEIIDYSLPLKDLFWKLMDLYPLLPARSFAIPLWSALELDDYQLDSFDFCQRIRIQGYPCSMLMISESHSRTLTGAASAMCSDDIVREELLCLSDPHSRVQARQSRVYVAIRVKINDFCTTEQYLASACLIEPRGFASDHTGYDKLCRAFESTRVYKKPRLSDTEDTWVVDLPITALKVLHAIANPIAGQHLLDSLLGDILDAEQLNDNLPEWVEARKNLAPPSLEEASETSPPEDELLDQGPVSNESLMVEAHVILGEQRPPPRTRRRYKMLKRARLSGVYDWMLRPLYGDKLPAWT